MDTFINPYTDFGFKKLFGEEKNKHLLISFLNDLLGDQQSIVDLTFKNSETLPDGGASRKAIFDIYCTNEKGEHFIVELQKAKQNYFKDRSVYYSTFPIQQQAKKGDWNFKLKAVYCIGVLDFVFDEDKVNDQVIHTVKLKNDHNRVFYEKLTFIYVQMPHFKKSLNELQNHRDRWLYFIKNLANLEDIPALFKDDIIYQGFEAARIAALDKQERQRYNNSLKEYRDLYSVMTTAHEEGYDAGELKKANTGAINLIKMKILSDQQIADAMELTIEQVKQLHISLNDAT